MASSSLFDGDYKVQSVTNSVNPGTSIPACGIDIGIHNRLIVVRIEDWRFEASFEVLGKDGMGNRMIKIKPKTISGPATTHAELKQLLTAFLPTLKVSIPVGQGNLYLSSEGYPRFEITMKTEDAIDPKLEYDNLLAQMGIQVPPR